MSSPVGYPQRNAYPMFSSTSQGDVPVGKNGANLIPVMANVTSSSGVLDKFDFARRTGAVAVVRSLGADVVGLAQAGAQKLDAVMRPRATLNAALESVQV